MEKDHHPIARRIMKKIRKEKNMDAEIHYTCLLQKHKQKLILERKNEIDELKKRMKYLEMELEGMGVKDYVG